MARLGETLFRFTGAMLLAASATAIDQPQILEAPSASSRISSVSVVVAAKDMPEGVVIGLDALVIAQWPAGTQPAGAFSTVDSVAQRVSRVAIYKGEAIVPGRLAPEGTGAVFEVGITPGKRAYGIRVNDFPSLAGMVQPNSRVDIMVVIDDPEQGKAVAKLFMVNMRVLAIGAGPERAQDGRPINAAVASIEVTPNEAEQLAIAVSQGSLQLVLRGYADPDSIAVARSGVFRDLLFRRWTTYPAPVPQRRRPVKSARPDSFALKVFRGVGGEELKFTMDSIRVARKR